MSYRPVQESEIRETMADVYAAIGKVFDATSPELGEEKRREMLLELCHAVRKDERLRCEVEVLKAIGANGRRSFREVIREAIHG